MHNIFIAPLFLDTHVLLYNQWFIGMAKDELELVFFFQTVINFLYCFLNNEDYPLEPPQEAS